MCASVDAVRLNKLARVQPNLGRPATAALRLLGKHGPHRPCAKGPRCGSASGPLGAHRPARRAPTESHTQGARRAGREGSAANGGCAVPRARGVAPGRHARRTHECGSMETCLWSYIRKEEVFYRKIHLARKEKKNQGSFPFSPHVLDLGTGKDQPSQGPVDEGVLRRRRRQD